MIVDTSALVAIFADEPERDLFTALLSGSERNLVAGGSWVEFATVLIRRFGVTRPQLVQRELREAFSLSIQAVTTEQVTLAIDGYARFGRGSGHLAGLNLGDCFAYALAKATGEPLLFKGDDFAQTDLEPAIRS